MTITKTREVTICDICDKETCDYRKIDGNDVCRLCRQNVCPHPKTTIMVSDAHRQYGDWCAFEVYEQCVGCAWNIKYFEVNAEEITNVAKILGFEKLYKLCRATQDDEEQDPGKNINCACQYDHKDGFCGCLCHEEERKVASKDGIGK